MRRRRDTESPELSNDQKIVGAASDRERHLHELANRLFFNLQKQGTRFTLTRDVDVPAPVRHENLTADEVEDVLNTWKLRGPHGG
jgi:hypothetical protein